MPWAPKRYEEMTAEAQARIASRLLRPAPAMPVAPLSPTPTIAFGQFENRQVLEWPIVQMAPRGILVTGTTGSGKTNYITHLERDFVLAGGGMLSVDPDGSHPRSKFIAQLKWIEETGIYKYRRVEVIDLNDLQRLIPFNNLAPIPGVHPTVIGDETSVAFQRVDGVDWRDTPLLEAIMVDSLSIAAEFLWTICEIRMLLDPEDTHGVRRWAIDHVQDDYKRATLERLDEAARAEKSHRDFRAMTQGPLNRLSDIERFDKTRLIAGAGSRFDLAQAADDAAIVLVDASSGNEVGDTAARTFMSLLTRAMFSTMRQRHHPDRLFLFSIDEAPAVIQGQQDIEGLAARARKYGVCLLFAMQYLQQATPEQYAALKNCCNTHVRFRTIDHKEAQEHVLDMVPIDLERPKESMIRPTQVGVERTTMYSRSRARHQSEGVSEATTESSSESESTTEAQGRSEASATSSMDAQGTAESSSAGQVLTPPQMMVTPISQSVGTGVSESSLSAAGASQMSGSMWMTAQSRASSRGEARSSAMHSTTGTSEASAESDALEPIFRDLPIQLFSLEESVHQAALTLKTLEPGEAIVAFGRMSAKIRVPFIPSPKLASEEAAALRRRFIDASPSSMPVEEARAAMAKRKADIIAAARDHMCRGDTPEADFGMSETTRSILDAPHQFATEFFRQRGDRPQDARKPAPRKRPGKRPNKGPDLRIIDGGPPDDGEKPKD